jgi:hypothetical protein
LSEPEIAMYAFHSISSRLSADIRSLTWLLEVKDPHPYRKDFTGFMELSAYRLRRTKGTAMVLSGATAEEVAEALDHQSVNSITHYFRYNLELQSFINQAHAASPDVVDAIEMWQGRFLEDDTDHTERTVPISSLGRCASTSVCPHHPTISCYGCSKFRPSRKADHQGALNNIKQFQNTISAHSSGPIAMQVEAALFGAQAILIALKEI